MIPVGRDDDHGFRRGVGQGQVETDDILARKAVHPAGKTADGAVVFEGELVVLAGNADIALHAGGRQGSLCEGGQVDPGSGDLAVCFKVQQGNAVHGHIAVVVDGQGQGETVAADGVIIPFLDPPRPGGDPGTVVGFDQFGGVTRLDETAVFIMKRAGGDDAALHRDSLLCSVFSSGDIIPLCRRKTMRGMNPAGRVETAGAGGKTGIFPLKSPGFYEIIVSGLGRPGRNGTEQQESERKTDELSDRIII